MQLFRETLTIAAGLMDSNALNLELAGSARLVTLNIFAPSTIDGTVKVHVATGVAGTYLPQQSNGQDIPVPQGRATLMHPLVAGGLRLKADTPQSANAVFQIVGELEPT